MGTSTDTCRMCNATHAALEEFEIALNSSFKPHEDHRQSDTSGIASHPFPILLTHFPLYRKSDTGCAGFLDYVVDRGDWYSNEVKKGAKREKEKCSRAFESLTSRGLFLHESLDMRREHDFFEGSEFEKREKNFLMNREGMLIFCLNVKLICR